MKKKLVAFAVTAAMVITSAVSALAWEVVDNTPAFDLTKNQVVLTSAQKDGIVDTVEKAIPEEGTVEFQTIVDLNRTSGWANFTINFSGDGDKKASVLFQATDDSTHNTTKKDVAVRFDGQSFEKGVNGIAVLNWSVSKKEVKVVVDELCTNKDNITLTTATPADVTTVDNIVLTATDKTVIYQYEAPTKVAEVMVAEYDQEKKQIVVDADDNPVPATQPVQGNSYVIYGIKLNDGTVITDTTEMAEYATVKWTAVNAKDENVLKGIHVFTYAGGKNFGIKIPGDGSFAGCTVSATATAVATSGIFGTATWGADFDPLAEYERLAGEDRYATALAIADKLVATNGIKSVVIANGDNYADALSATALAKKKEAPILLVNDAHEDEVVAWIEKNVKDYRTDVYIVGGSNVVSEDFAAKLFRYTPKRLAGEDRYETNLEILKELNSTAGNILICSGSNYPDALSASATGRPILLVGDTLTADQVKFLTEKKASLAALTKELQLTVIGGNKVVSDDMYAVLATFDEDGTMERLYGADRYETNEKVVNKYFATAPKDIDNIVLASGNGFADALAGAAFAAQQTKTPVVIVDDNNYDRAANLVKRATNADIYVVGGEVSVSSELVQKIA